MQSQGRDRPFRFSFTFGAPWYYTPPVPQSGRKPMRSVYILAVAVLASACTATVDKQSVKATQTAPESTQVEVVRIPYDPSLPYYVRSEEHTSELQSLR